ncbi:beta-propeller domain-containing protein [Paenibacillus filicis]|uniref:Beta-propeller domain-containing protein n=1 Tax=Paenibacillus filicis TaxID=669464 RepID=A0ABU9DC91_9BACL
MKKSRKLIALALALVLLIGATPVDTSADSEEELALSLNGHPVRFELPPRLVQHTMMVPLQEVSEALGVHVAWNEASRTATASKGNASIRLTLESTKAYKGETEVSLPVAPVMQSGSLLVPLRFFSEAFDFHVYWDASSRKVSIADADQSLPTIGSVARLEELLKEAEAGLGSGIYPLSLTDQSAFMKAPQAVPAATEAKSSAAPSSEAGSAYSTTNVQVEGVDEADIIKTDGQFIYQVNRERVIITKAVPAESMTVVGSVYWADPAFSPRELYVDDKHLIIVGSGSHPVAFHPVGIGSQAPDSLDSASGAAIPAEPAAPDSPVQVQPLMIQSKRIGIPSPRQRMTTKVLVYELADRSNLQTIRQVELEGHYISSRKVGDELYLVTSKSFPAYGLLRDGIQPAEKETAASPPSYRDSVLGDAFQSIGLEDVRYFPKAVESNYLLIGGLDLSKPAKGMQVTSYLGPGGQVYASTSHLYVAASENEVVPAPAPAVPPGSGGSSPSLLPPDWEPSRLEQKTAVYRFEFSNGEVSYTGRGKVPGHPLNQFSMDEYDGYFRIATTNGDMWRSDEFASKNNVYVLDETMSVTGRLEGLAPGERIYSVRYAGKRAYMVTFRNVDPLFALDLSDPKAPAVLGQLKIPGYSDYLHPYDENHLIGFGKEAVEVPAKRKGNPGQEAPIAYYQGMKIALFDVSDPTQPKELFKETIGDRGTSSELLDNHKALLFSKEKNLLAFPVTVMKVQDPSAANPSSYGQFAYQGAHVYSLDLQQGFQLRGKITHLTAEDLSKAGNGWYQSDRNIERLLYIGDMLYSASPDRVKAHRLSDLQETGSVTLPPWTPRPRY